ncbi:MAG: glycosyltransferase family 9 protein [Thermodesulfobacteriota bacterium]
MRIGVWNTAFLGDAVLTLPLLHTLERAYPGAELHFFVRRGLAPLFAAQPGLAAVHEFDKRGADRGLRAAMRRGRDLARMRFDLWISPHTSLRSGLIARWTTAPRRIGYSRPAYNHYFYTHTVDRAFGRAHEIDRLLRLVRPLGVNDLVAEPRLVLPAAAEARAAEFFAALPPGPVLGVHPGSTWPTKQWPEEYFGQVMARAHAAGAAVVLFAGPDEKDCAARVLAASGLAGRDNVHDLAGRLSLPELAAHLARLDCYLTGDSGPMHLAWAGGAPVVALFGPTTRDLGFFPRGSSTVLELDLDCRPCGLHGPRSCPKGHHRCMRDLTPETAWTAVKARLDRIPAA